MIEKIKPKKKLGQNFLINKYTINTLVEFINLSENDHILEVGPGQGALTESIIKKTKHYIGIEKDSNLCGFLKNKYNNIQIKNEDILDTHFEKIYKDKYKIVGNIPYNISTKLLIKCIENKNNIQNIHFMMQKEFVNRIISKCNSKSYGRLTVLMQLFFTCEKLIDIAPSDFFPQPKVNSSFLKLTPIKRILLKKEEVEGFLLFTKIIFGKRRKKIRNCLDIKNIDIYDNINKRAEELNIDEMINLYREINYDRKFI